jgi:hypothetical protein
MNIGDVKSPASSRVRRHAPHFHRYQCDAGPNETGGHRLAVSSVRRRERHASHEHPPALVVDSKGKRTIIHSHVGDDKTRSNPAWSKLQLPFMSDFN